MWSGKHIITNACFWVKPWHTVKAQIFIDCFLFENDLVFDTFSDHLWTDLLLLSDLLIVTVTVILLTFGCFPFLFVILVLVFESVSLCGRFEGFENFPCIASIWEIVSLLSVKLFEVSAYPWSPPKVLFMLASNSINEWPLKPLES